MITNGMKRCFRCGVLKDCGAFYPNKAKKDGYGDECKACRAEYYGRNRDKILDYQRQYNSDHATEVRRNVLIYYWKNREKLNQIVKERSHREESLAKNRAWKRKHLEAVTAQRHIAELVRRGDIESNPSCELCASNRKTIAHHPDYLKPKEIMWLCHLCHQGLHRWLREIKRGEYRMNQIDRTPNRESA